MKSESIRKALPRLTVGLKQYQICLPHVTTTSLTKESIHPYLYKLVKLVAQTGINVSLVDLSGKPGSIALSANFEKLNEVHYPGILDMISEGGLSIGRSSVDKALLKLPELWNISNDLPPACTKLPDSTHAAFKLEFACGCIKHSTSKDYEMYISERAPGSEEPPRSVYLKYLMFTEMCPEHKKHVQTILPAFTPEEFKALHPGYVTIHIQTRVFAPVKDTKTDEDVLKQAVSYLEAKTGIHIPDSECHVSYNTDLEYI